MRFHVVVAPAYRGTALGLSRPQRDAKQTMDRFARGALVHRVEELYPIYEALPEPIRERAVAMVSGLDVGSVPATTRFLASGAEPFDDLEELAATSAPTLLIPGQDAEHSPEIADLYAQQLRRCEPARAAPEPGRAIRQFCAALGATF